MRNMRSDAAELAHLGRLLLQAKDGRARRWPLVHCAARLQANGASPALAQACAQAVGRVAAAVQALAAKRHG